MREYLVHFFDAFAYEESDAAYLLAAYDKIRTDPAASAMLDTVLAMYQEKTDCDFPEIIAIADRIAEKLYLHAYTVELLVFLCLSRHLEELYAAQGIDRQIYYDSMMDLRYKLEECKLVNGIVGSFVTRWFARFFNLTRFALGRLQFEIVEFKYHYEKDGKVLIPGSKVVNVHIPRSSVPLTQELCTAAYRQAYDFFRDTIGEPFAFVCHSWLLYPENETLIPPHTNIYRFMHQFDIIDSGTNIDNKDLWRLFDTKELHPDRLPTDTSVRRNYVAHLKQGGKTGWGYGVLFADSL